ncbi:hypothetical protein HRG_003297 [Hirsutella rhossiliensis]|uniref:Uncharacterized protein n=1 Tax=Hirsutella rhossiliensis TaxID=111463 RepID=A0A9P8SJU5_9HYPO|nr:uncharacterized protein HRG_03297 [Hirsutella rhossiliensis]KAH0965281.1 hypothetical protein HRG_03297 [Hirsutella rhossiliensis]
MIKTCNPPGVIGKSYDKTAELLNHFKTTRDLSGYDELMADATSLPSLTTEAAVDGMDKIVEKAKKK